MWLSLLLCELNLLVMHYYILTTSHFLWESKNFNLYIENFISCTFDICFLFIIFYYASGKKQKAALIICFFITLTWSLSSVLYSRFFHQYLSLSAIEQFSALYNGVVLKCVIEGLRLTDCYYIFSTFIFLFIIKQSKQSKTRICNIFYLIALSLVFDILSFASYHTKGLHKKFMASYYNRHFSYRDIYSFPSSSHFVRGSIRMIIFEILDTSRNRLKLSEDQINDIKQMIEKSRTIPSESEKSTKISKSTNIIFIIVESYMSFVSDMRVEGREVTPFLNTLKHDSTTYYNGKMHENITIGESSDGQFIYMTGLLPIRSAVTVSKARNTTMPGLPQKIQKKSFMIIPTESTMWNQDIMSRVYGFDNLYTSGDYEEGNLSTLNDEQVFHLAMQKDMESKQPFFSVILTMSMHGPYTKQIEPTFPITSQSLPKDLACYLNACHYTDIQLKKYFEHLKNTRLYENSLIVIAADHCVHNTDFGGASKYIPFYLVNVPFTIRSKMWKDECNQIDVYSTLLELLEIKSEWYGLGNSLLSQSYKNNIETKKWDISEWIIRSDYFSNPPKD